MSRLAQRLDRASRSFEVGVLEHLVAREPENLEHLASLAEACTRARRYRRGLELDRELVARVPDNPVFHHNLACSRCLTGDLEGAAESLNEALDRGFDDAAFVLRDPDLRRLRAHELFASVRARLADLEQGDS